MTPLAGPTLVAEVEAPDTRGRRQLERDAGRIRVAGKVRAKGRPKRPFALDR